MTSIENNRILRFRKYFFPRNRKIFYYVEETCRRCRSLSPTRPARGVSMCNQAIQTTKTKKHNRETQTDVRHCKRKKIQTTAAEIISMETQTECDIKDDKPTESDSTIHAAPSMTQNSASKIWETLKTYGDPRLVLSIPRFSYAYNKDHFDLDLFGEALKDVVSHAERCGFLFNEEDRYLKRNFGEGVPVESTPYHRYSFVQINDMDTIYNELKPFEGVQEGHGSLEDISELFELENYINVSARSSFEHHKRNSKNSIRVPVVLLVIGGDLSALEHVVRAIHRDISVVVVKGSGGTADMVDSCIKGNATIRDVIPIMFLQRFSNDTLAKVEQAVDNIREKGWLVSSYDPSTESNHVLWETITNGVMKAWSFEADIANTIEIDRHPFFTNDGLSISKHVVNISWLTKKELFGGYAISTETDNISLQNTFIDAVVENRTDIIEEINQRSPEMMSLPEGQIREISEKISLKRREKRRKTKVAGSIDLLKIIDKDAAIAMENVTVEKESATSMEDTTNKNDALAIKKKKVKEAKRVLAKTLLKGGCLFQCGKNCSCKDRSIHDELKSHSENQNVYNETFLDTILLNDKSRFDDWQYCDFPLLTALVASALLSQMAKTAGACFEEELQDSHMKHSILFQERAIKLLDELYSLDNNMARQALDHVGSVWVIKESPIRFGHHYNIEEFISHSAAQKDVNSRMFAFHDTEYSSENDEAIALEREKTGTKMSTSPEFAKRQVIRQHNILTFIKHHWNLKSLGKLVSAPITRVVLHLICFLAALVFFSIFLTTELQESSISIMEAVIFAFIIGELVEDVWSTVRTDDDNNCSGHRIILHLYNIWIILDYLFIITYMVAFLLHSFESGSLVHVRRLYSVSLFFMFLRLFKFFLLLKKLGIIIIMVKEMLKDLLLYLVILFVLLLGAGVVYHANLYPLHGVNTFSSRLQTWRIWTILKIPFWQVFGEPLLETIEGTDVADCTFNETLWRNNPNVDRCPTYDWITPVIAALYMMLTNWLLLNIVIAMFSARFKSINEKAVQKWRYHRHSVVIDYEDRYPSPFNIPIRLYRLIFCGLCVKPCLKCCREISHSTAGVDKMLAKQKEFAQYIIKNENQQSK